MNQQTCDHPTSQNSGFPATLSSSELPLSNAAEVCVQANKFGQLPLILSREKTQSTNDTIKSINTEAWKQVGEGILEYYPNNNNQYMENVADPSENASESDSLSIIMNQFLSSSGVRFADKNPDIADEENKIECETELISYDHFDDEYCQNGVRGVEIDDVFYRNCLDDNPFSEVPDHAINMTAQNNDLNFEIVQDVLNISAKEDYVVPKSRPQKSSKPFIIHRNVQRPKPKSKRGRKKEDPKPSLCNPSLELNQLKTTRSQKTRDPLNWEKDMHRDLEKNSKQDKINPSYDFIDYFRSSTDEISPLFSSNANFNEAASGLWLNPECNDILNTFKTENPGLINSNEKNLMIQNELLYLIGCPSTSIPEANKEKQLRKPRADPKKKLKTNHVRETSEVFCSKKSSPSDFFRGIDFKDESEDEYSELQDEREARRKPRQIQNKTLKVVNQRTIPDLPPRQELVTQPQSNELDVSQVTFGASQIRKSFFTVVVNRMFALLNDEILGKEFRDIIKRTDWFKYLVKRTKWFRSVFQASQKYTEIIFQQKKLYDEGIQILKWCEEAGQIDQENFQRYQEALMRVRSYEEALDAEKQCEKEMERRWYQAAMHWKQLQNVIGRNKWAKDNKDILPQDWCNKCRPETSCDECCEFKNVCALLHAIYKKGVDEEGQERGEIRSLEKLSEIVGNESFSEAFDVVEMGIKEFCQKSASTVMAIFLSEEERFYETAFEELYDAGRNKKKQPDEKEILDEKRKRELHIRFKSDIRKRFAKPQEYLRSFTKREKQWIEIS